MKNLHIKFNFKISIFLFCSVLFGVLMSNLNQANKIQAKPAEASLVNGKEHLQDKAVPSGNLPKSEVNAQNNMSTSEKNQSQKEDAKIASSPQKTTSEKKGVAAEKSKDTTKNKNNSRENVNKNKTTKSSKKDSSTKKAKPNAESEIAPEASAKTSEQDLVPAQATGNSDDFAFIKANAEANAWLKDGKILLYGGIALIIISIVGLFITLKPKNLKRKRRQ